MSVSTWVFLFFITLIDVTVFAQEYSKPTLQYHQLDSLFLIEYQYKENYKIRYNENLYLSQTEKDSIVAIGKKIDSLRYIYLDLYYNLTDSLFNIAHQPCLAYTLYRLPQVYDWLGYDSIYIYDWGNYYLLPECVRYLPPYKYVSIVYDYGAPHVCDYSSVGRFEYKKMKQAWQEMNFDSARTVNLINILLDSLPFGLRNATELRYLAFGPPMFASNSNSDFKMIKEKITKTYGKNYFNIPKDFEFALDTIPSYFSGFKKLRALSVYCITDLRDISSLETSDSLLFLSVFSDKITDEMIESISRIKNLQVLFIRDNSKSMTISPEKLAKLAHIKNVHLCVSRKTFTKLKKQFPEWNLTLINAWEFSLFTAYQMELEIPEDN